MSSLNRLLSVAAAVALATTLVAAAPAKGDGPESFPSPAGGKITLDTKHLKRPTLLVFAADFCPACRRETPEFVALAAELRGQVDVVGVVMDAKRAKAKRYVDTHKIGYPTIWDPEWRFAMRYGVKATPTLVLLAEDGAVRMKAPGLTDKLRGELGRK